MENNNAFGKAKILKDPIYGYISIPREYMNNIVDTAEFQRLRRIMQTSYSPLYSSALHNRFVHSLGVFYLGTIAAKSLIAANDEKEIIDTKKMKKLAEVYKLACLLHDVGHAPFSHTGEVFYDRKVLAERLKEVVGTNSLKDYIDSIGQSKGAANHEVMSAIIGIERFSDFIGDKEDQEFFARCITGYMYDMNNTEDQIKNCFISMLNSKVIDVDRLDYLIRDAYSSGYDTINIDYMRLLNSLTIVKANECKVAFKKNAISVIENVVYAHDAEKKWIQNHPVVVYEMFLLQRIITQLNEIIVGEDKNKKISLFSEQTLGTERVTFPSGRTVSLLSDDDIVYLCKDMLNNEVCEEYFDRSKRRHPIWKSESEYKAYIGSICLKGELKNEFQKLMNELTDQGGDHVSYIIINDDFENKLKQEKEIFEKMLEKKGISLSYEVYEQGLNKKMLLAKYLREEATKRGVKFDFVILKASVFESDFSKEGLGNTCIVLDDSNKVYKLKEVCSVLTAQHLEDKDDFYYIFYKRSKDVEGFSNMSVFCRKFFEVVTKDMNEVTEI